MSTLASLLLVVSAQDVLPPPPEPTGSPEIDTVRVIGVVLVSLGIIVLLALALRPLVVRPGKAPEPADPTEEDRSDDEPDLFASPGAGSIIQFPRSASAEAIPQPAAWDETNTAVADRFHRVVGERNRRRKLGDRQPERTPHDLAAAALHRVAPDVIGRQPRVAAEQTGTVVPLRGAANGTDGQMFLGPLTGETVGSPPWAARSTRAAEPPAVSRSGADQNPPLEAIVGSSSAQAGDASAADPLALGADRLADEPAAAGFAAERQERPESIPAMEHDPSGDHHAAAVHLNGHSATEPPPFMLDIPFAPLPEPAMVRTDPAVKQTDELVLPAGFDATVSAEIAEPVDAEPETQAEEIDTPTLAALHQVVRELIHCANSGQLLHGFSLYSDPFLFRFMDGSGMTEDEFRDVYGSVPARPRDEWDHLDRLYDVVRLPDGRIEATACYVDGAGQPSNGIERYRFVLVDGAWRIDDIAPVESTG